jgi:hypothetical protein
LWYIGLITLLGTCQGPRMWESISAEVAQDRRLKRMSVETLAEMQSAAMTVAEHLEVGQLDFDDEMLRIISDEPVQMQAQETNSLFGRIRNSRAGNLLTKATVVFTGIGGGGAGILAATAEAHTPQAHIASNATAANVFDWSHVGGNPLVPGGVQTVGAAKAFLESGNGRAALSSEGLTPAEVAAVEKAVRANKLRNCTIPAGVIIPTMVSGNGEVDHNVVLDDPSHPNGIPGFCVDATRTFMQGRKKVTETIKEGVAGPCANALELGKSFVSVNQPKPRKAKVEVFKIALSELGNQFFDNNGHAIDPTGTFRFEAKCKDGKKTVDKIVTYNQSPQPLVECNIGSTVTVNELSTLGPEQWDMLSPGVQAQIVAPKGNEFVFKDKEHLTTPPPVTGPSGPQGPPGPTGGPPPPQAPTPPTIEFTALPPAQEQFTDGTTNQDCAIAVSPNGDAQVVEFSASDTNGSIGPVYQPDQFGSPNLYCAQVTIETGNNSADPSFAVDGKVTDIVTGLSATAVDNMGTQSMPSFGN